MKYFDYNRFAQNRTTRSMTTREDGTAAVREAIAQARARMRNAIAQSTISIEAARIGYNRLDAALGEALEALSPYSYDPMIGNRIEIAILRALNGEEKP